MLPIQKWSEGELQRLIAAGQEENLQLEFKRAIADDDKAKTELSKDVSAFANTIGGHIIYGIEESPDPPSKAVRITPIDPRRISKEWLEQVINSRIQPRILGIRMHSVDLPTTAPGQVAYVVEIPESSSAHQAYDNFESVPMADHEVRQAMNRASKPAYAVWFDPHVSTQHTRGVAVGFRATVVNESEITPSSMSATLYLPKNAFGQGGEPWDFVSIEGIEYRRFEGRIEKQWHPGRPSQLYFEQAEQSIPEWQIVAPMLVHLKLFDNWGLALHEKYAVALPGLTHTVLLSESDRKPSAVGP